MPTRIAGYDACILGYDPTYSTFGSSSICWRQLNRKLCPRRAGFRDPIWVITPDAPAFSNFGEAFSLLSMSSPAMPASVTPEGGYPSCGHDSCSDDSGYPSCDYDSCSDDSGKLSIPVGGIKGHRINGIIPCTRAKGKICVVG